MNRQKNFAKLKKKVHHRIGYLDYVKIKFFFCYLYFTKNPDLIYFLKKHLIIFKN